MRQSIRRQLGLAPALPAHAHAEEMAAISGMLDRHPEIEALVERDIVRAGVARHIGRNGMSADQVLRALVVKQLNQFSYEELAFHLLDSMTYRSFCRFGAFESVAKKSALQDNVRRISADTLEQINRVLVGEALHNGAEKGKRVRMDSTPVETNIHEPSDSSLLWDVVRVLVRLLKQAEQLVAVTWSDHRRRARRRTVGIIGAGNARRQALYRDLIKIASRTVGYAERALVLLRRKKARADSLVLHELEHLVPLAHRVLDQARRRVLDGECVPATDKVLSIFEPDTDLIVRGRRDPTYGHKLCLTVGSSSLVLDCVVEEGNPTDSTLAQKLVQRAKDVLGAAPEQAVFDGGFSSRDNVSAIKSLGVRTVVFTKHLGITVDEMTQSNWLFKRLRRFRAGIEACISFLKRCLGLARCTWRGGRSAFKAYVWSSVVAANLLTLARHELR